jgi:hypothetical protein
VYPRVVRRCTFKGFRPNFVGPPGAGTPSKSVAGLCIYTESRWYRRLFANYHHPSTKNGLQLLQYWPFYLPGWPTQARDLQNSEHREQNLRRHPGPYARALRSTIYQSREWKGPSKSTIPLATDAPDKQQWDIQPLGPGYTIRKVAANSIILAARLLDDFNRPNHPPPRSRTSSVSC